MAKHLTLAQREKLSILIHQDLTQTEIGKIIGIHQSTVSRELQRNRLSRNNYSPSQAHCWSKVRRVWSRHKLFKWYENPKLLKYVVGKLRENWSPDQISGRIQSRFPHDVSMRVSHESIYKYIRIDKQNSGSLYKYLRFGKKRKKRYGSKNNRGLIPNRVGIEKRPIVVDKKIRVGDWESDLVIGKRQKQAIATFVERKTKLLLAIKMEARTAKSMVNATMQALSSIPKKFRLTMTHDNGKEIALHQLITKLLGIEIYCANPYSSWERGLNENTNGLLRQFFPKSSDFSLITQKEIDHAVSLLNNRPRKSLNYRTPLEVFNEHSQYAFQG